MDERQRRLHPPAPGTAGADGRDHRTVFARDRDRILYSASFRRLAVVTQVLSPTEGFAGHNRLTHALKVAQVARRLAEYLQRIYPLDQIESLGGLDADVAESAGLAHDLGHPPFGHIAEEELDELLVAAGVADGFEGNAQSFRIVTKLEIRDTRAPGLNLSRATLNSLLKYPWRKGEAPQGKSPAKYGAYFSEQEDYAFARSGSAEKQRSLEAEVMDWADDITYSAHDLEDFYRFGKIPLANLASDSAERDQFLDRFFERRDLDSTAARAEWRAVATSLFDALPVTSSYEGSRTQKAALRAYVGQRIQRALNSTKLGAQGLARDPLVEQEVTLLKELTVDYVITDKSTEALQLGQRAIIRTLFQHYREQAAHKNRWSLFPPVFRELLEDAGGDEAQQTRVVADLISGMGEAQAIDAYRSVSNVSWSLY